MFRVRDLQMGVVAGWLAVSLTAAAARPEPENQPDPRTRRGPAIEWCRQPAGGAPKVLFITPAMGAWDVYALAQRMDLEFDVCYTQQPWIFAPATDYYHEGIKLLPDVTADLRALLDKEWDVIAFTDFAPMGLPPELQFRVLEKVTQGTGAVTFMSNRWPTALPRA